MTALLNKFSITKRFSFLLLFGCLLIVGKISSQEIYVSTDKGVIYLVNTSTCDTVRIANTGVVWGDIAICGGNGNVAYGVSGIGDVYTIDLTTGAYTIVNNQFGPLYGNTLQHHYLNALVCDGNGKLYAGDFRTNNIYCYDIATDTWSVLGSTGVGNSYGDLTFYNGKLYLAGLDSYLTEMTISPFTATQVGTHNIPNVFGVITVGENTLCGAAPNYQMIGSSVRSLYNDNPTNAQLTLLCSNIIPTGSVLNGSASIYEGLTPSNSAGIKVDVSATPNCPGGNVRLIAHGANTYQWKPGNLTGLSININPTTTTTYTVIGTDLGGCIDSVFVQVNVSEINFAPVITSATCGSSVGAITLNATSTVSGAVTYLWNTNATTPDLTGLAAGGYTVTATNAQGCTSTTAVTVNTAGGAVAAMNIPTPLTCNGGSNGIASVTVSNGTGPYTYTWSNAPTVTTSSSTTALITNLVAGDYTVSVTDALGCFSTTTVTITAPPKLVMSAGAVAPTCFGVCDGQAIIAPNGWTPSTIVWDIGGGGLVKNTLCPGTYSVTATDASGCTKDTSLTIQAPSQMTITPTVQLPNCNQFDGSISILASGGNGSYNYNWDNNITTANNSGLQSGSYCLTVTDISGCIKDTCFVLSNATGVVASIQSNTPPGCFAGCDGTALASASGSSGYSYAWSNAQTTATATGLCVGTHTVTITDLNSCSSIATVNITEPAILTLQTNPVSTICVGQSTTLSASTTGGTGAYTYSWFPSGPTVSPAIATTYTVIVRDGNGCTNQQTVSVSVNSALTINAIPTQGLCPGDSVLLSANASGGDNNLTYTWMPGNFVTRDILVKPITNQTYTVTVNDGCNSAPVSTTVTVSINALPTVGLTPSATTGCEPVSFTFQDNSTVAGGTIVGWLWDFGSGATSTLQQPTHFYDSSGVYSVTLTVTSDKGCVATGTSVNVVTVHPKPIADFSLSPDVTSILNPDIQFTNQSNGEIVWSWNFGDPSDIDNTSNLENPGHTYADTGVYRITLIVTSNEGCKDTAINDVYIKGDFAFYVPNAFSPNRDGTNEGFNGKGIGIKKYKMLIFDRWGAIIYKTEDLNSGWDGRVQGGDEVAQQDVYVYMIELTSIFSKNYRYLGHVTLVK